MTRGLAVAGITLVLTAIGGVMHYAGASDVATFIVTGLALGGVAWQIGIGTESVATRLGPAATGVVQSTLGNLPGFFIVLFALSDGETVVAQTSILGGLLVNALLMLGLAIVIGARVGRGGVMTFDSRLPNDTATLLLLSVFIIVLLGLSETVGDRASEHQVAISVVGAVCLLGVYLAWLSGYLGGDSERRPAPKVLMPRILPLRVAVVLLAVAGVAAAFVSSWFVTALGPTADELGISRAFTGLVLVAIAGTAIPNAIGLALAGRGQADLAISVISNSVSQIAAVVYPASVLVSLFFADRLTFVLNPVYIGALVLGSVAVWQITGDGRAMAFEGAALISLYVVLGVLAFYE